MPPTCRAIDVPGRCARTDASGAIGREALDTADVSRRCARTVAGGAIGREALDCRHTVASGARIKPGEALPREALDAANVPLDVPRRVLPSPARPEGRFGIGNKHYRPLCFP